MIRIWPRTSTQPVHDAVGKARDRGEGEPGGWLRQAATRLAALVDDRGMTISVAAAESLLRERLSRIANRLGISWHQAQRGFDVSALDAFADRLVAAFATEEPGGDLFSLPRTAQISVSGLGRLIAGLAESLLAYERTAALDDAERAARRHEITELLSVAGLMQSDSSQGDVSAPPAVFLRTARIFTTVADLTDQPELANTLRRDAIRARTAAVPEMN